MDLPELRIRLPQWLLDQLGGAWEPLPSAEAQMRFVIALARENIRQGSGGPFAAAVFDPQGNLVAPGLNIVTSSRCSIMHAEMLALALAQQRLGSHDLSDGGRRHLTLVASAEPCAMCLGAIPWSGVARLVVGARDEDVRAIGFDEGAKPEHWSAALASRGIEVERDLLRAEAIAVLRAYSEAGGAIY
ncbi:tRNA-specific adenosine deaminase [Halorhodospira abdelmalekii]|uniref:nucleoside deaminase n=1 Tax=Halorhodospira abdelmalekii TaxID=421629 RepID=UPI001903226B|nr:nucleoside deaminase [Halorhodospira abdelmalekii]MBK1734561.1 tRNA-specific adenosine deaminase [Halorhodospira abdelmalekii]